MSTIVKTVARWVTGFIFLYGLYIMAYGHLTPGGGFAGGVILASAFVLLLMAYGQARTAEVLPYTAAARLDSVGAMFFWAMAILGLLAGGRFFLNVIQRDHPGQPFDLFNAGIIPLCNVAIALKVCASLVVVAMLLAAVRVLGGGTDEDFRSEET
jgi:multisubunit Na+/H+ antiporter MnhB subunit